MAQIKINGIEHEIRLTLGVFRRLDEVHGISLNNVVDDLNAGKFGSILKTCYEGVKVCGYTETLESFEDSFTLSDLPNLQQALTDALPNVQPVEKAPKKAKK